MQVAGGAPSAGTTSGPRFEVLKPATGELITLAASTVGVADDVAGPASIGSPHHRAFSPPGDYSVLERNSGEFVFSPTGDAQDA